MTAMHSEFDTPSPMSVVIFLAAIILISRLVRWGRLLSDNSTRGDIATPPARSCLWGRARKLEKLNQSTALVRAEAELFHSKIDHVQAHHQFERLVAELRPPVPAVPARPAPGVGNPASLTLPEIEQMIAAMPEINPEVRRALLQLLAARLQEKME